MRELKSFWLNGMIKGIPCRTSQEVRELKLYITVIFWFSFGRTSQEVRELKSKTPIAVAFIVCRTSQEVRELKYVFGVPKFRSRASHLARGA